MASDKDKESRTTAKAQSRNNEKEGSHSQSKEHEKRGSGQHEHETKNKSSQSKQGRDARLPAGKSGRTTDHEIIRRWIEERGGSPAAVKATEHGDDPGLLRINFPGYSGENRLEDISWDDFFKKFDEKNLEFLYQDETRDGEMSRFWKFVSREGGHEKDKGK